jgi:hypothetical protein
MLCLHCFSRTLSCIESVEFLHNRIGCVGGVNDITVFD